MIFPPVIGLFGISGSGKTHLARRIVEMRPEMLRVSASMLLKSAHRTTGERLRTANAERVVDNQKALASAFREWRDAHEPHPVLLEAHALIDNDRELVEVPFETIRAIDLAAILSIEADPVEIAERRRRDDRNRPVRTIDELGRQQARSLELTSSLSKRLGIPFQSTNSHDLAAAVRIVDLVCFPRANVSFRGCP
jgi:adenylate kinase